MKIKRIGIFSFVKLAFFIMLFVGLVIGIFFGMLSQIISNQLGMKGYTALGIWIMSLIVIPLLISAITIVVSVLTAATYNLFAKLFGGIEIGVDEEAQGGKPKVSGSLNYF